MCLCLCVCIYSMTHGFNSGLTWYDSERFHVTRNWIACCVRVCIWYAGIYVRVNAFKSLLYFKEFTLFSRLWLATTDSQLSNRVCVSLCVCLTSFSFIVTVCSRRCNRLTAFEMAPLSFVHAFVLLARSVKWILSLNCQKSGDSMDERIRKIAGENDGKRINEREWCGKEWRWGGEGAERVNLNTHSSTRSYTHKYQIRTPLSFYCRMNTSANA